MNYEQKKQQLIKQIKVNKGNIKLKKSTSNLFRYRKKDNRKSVGVKNFTNVIHVDTKNRIAEVEGMTTYEKLVDETLKYNLLPTVVPQLKTITIGGATTGLGIESSSFKFGLVHETITEMDILLSNGDVMTCSKDKNSDLFFGFPNSYGTLGYVLKLKVKLIPIKKYVKLQHTTFPDAEKYFQEIKKLCLKARKDKSIDYIDGTIFSQNRLVITKAQFVDHAPYKSDYTGMNIYYKSIKRKKVDYLTTKDYIWRWDTDWFWCSQHFFVQNKAIRFLFPKKMLHSKIYWKIRALSHKIKILDIINKLIRKKGESVVQDVEIPVEHCAEFMDFFHNEIGIKPVWVCPTNILDKNVTFDLYPMDKSTLYINFGFWDIVPTKEEEGFYNKKIERKVRELKGKKSLYSTSYYSPEEFWELYNKNAYDKLKAAYDPDKKFPNLYEKCVGRR